MVSGSLSVGRADSSSERDQGLPRRPQPLPRLPRYRRAASSLPDGQSRRPAWRPRVFRRHWSRQAAACRPRVAAVACVDRSRSRPLLSALLPHSWSAAQARLGRCSCWPPVSEQAPSRACGGWAQRRRRPPSSAPDGGSAWPRRSPSQVFRTAPPSSGGCWRRLRPHGRPHSAADRQVRRTTHRRTAPTDECDLRVVGDHPVRSCRVARVHHTILAQAGSPGGLSESH